MPPPDDVAPRPEQTQTDPAGPPAEGGSETADTSPPATRRRRRFPGFTRLGIRSLALRLVAGSAILIIVGLTGGAYALLAVYQDAVRKEFDRGLDNLYGEVLGGIDRNPQGKLYFKGRGLGIFREQVSGWYWQIVHKRKVILQSISLGGEVLEVEAPPRQGSNFFYEVDGPFGKRLRVLARSVELDPADGKTGGEPHIFLIAGDWSGQERSIAEFAVTIAIALGGLGLFLLLAVFIQVRFGLAPLRRVPPALAAIRTGKADRLTGTFPTEVQPLATEINQLLDHNARVVERARTHVGNLAHALKTPLAVLTNEAGTRDSEMSRIVDEQTGLMREQVEHHLSRARMAARAAVVGASTSVMPVIEGLQRTLEKIYGGRGIKIAVEGPHDVTFRGERQDLEELLGNLMDNACKWAASRVRVTVTQDTTEKGPRLFVDVEDDGPGLTPSERVQAVKRGQRMDEATPGSGLGLSIVSDIADSYGGSFTLHDSSMSGLMARLELPVSAK